MNQDKFPDPMEFVRNGGPAFPADEYALMRGLTGMTLRDYFASKALQIILDNCLRSVDGIAGFKDGWREGCVKAAYKMADEMIKARGE